MFMMLCINYKAHYDVYSLIEWEEMMGENITHWRRGSAYNSIRLEKIQMHWKKIILQIFSSK